MRGSDEGPRVLVVGWDAGCFTYLQQHLDAGRLPNLSRLMSRGAHGVVESTQPPMTPVAWTTITTGCNPGRHGIFNWWYPDGDDYALHPYSAADVAVPNLFRLLSESGVRVAAVNIPMTTPVQEVNGFILGGLSHAGRVLDFKPNSVYPTAMLDVLQEHFPDFLNLDASAFEGYTTDEDLISRWSEAEALRLEVIAHLVEEHRPQLLWVHCHAGDYFGHRVRQGDAILTKAFELIDGTIGALQEMCSQDATTFVVSDHGQIEIERFILIQNWLEREGLLHFHHRIPQDRFGNTCVHLLKKLGLSVREDELKDTILGLADMYYQLPPDVQSDVTDLALRHVPGCLKSHENIDWDRTVAYSCTFYGHIRVNLEGREAHGIVDPRRYDEVVERICDGLEQICDPETNIPIGIKAFGRDEAYRGERTVDAPDVVCSLSDYSYYFCPIHSLHLLDAAVVAPLDHEALNRSFRFLDQTFRGDHSPAGMFVVHGPGMAASGAQAPIKAADITPTLMTLFDLAVPDYMDGIAQNHLLPSVRLRPADSPRRTAATADVDGEMRTQLMDDLRNLGYHVS